MDIQATLQWFFSDRQFALYPISQTDSYPLTVEPQDTTLNTLVGGVDIQILSASLNEDNPDQASFLSTMTVNISALQGAGVSTISCGSLGVRQTIGVRLNSNIGQFKCCSSGCGLHLGGEWPQ